MCLRKITNVPYKVLEMEYIKQEEEMDFHFERVENTIYLISK